MCPNGEIFQPAEGGVCVLELKRSKCEKRIFSAIPTGEQDAFQ
jgi:hypothetical protein